LNNNDRSHYIDHYWCQPLLYSIGVNLKGTTFVSPCIVQYWRHPVKWNIGVTLQNAISVSPCIVQYWSHIVISILESPSEVQYWCHPVLHNIDVTLYCTLSVPPCIQIGPLLWPPQLICSFKMRPNWNQRPGITINCYLWTFVLEDDYVYV